MRIEYEEEINKIYTIIGIGDLFVLEFIYNIVIKKIKYIIDEFKNKYINIIVNGKGERKSLFIGVNDSYELITRDCSKIDSIYNMDKRYEDYKIYSGRPYYKYYRFWNQFQMFIYKMKVLEY